MDVSSITPDERETFDRRGLLHLHGFLPHEVIAPARDAVLRAVSRSREGAALVRDGQWHLDGWLRNGGVAAGAPLAKGAKHARALREVFTTALRERIEALLGEPAAPTLTKHPALLFTLPNAQAWTVPRSVWHVDLPRLPGAGVPGVQAFVFLGDVPPTGGGTLVVTGSHRLLNDRGFLRSKQIKRALKREPWFAALFSEGCPDRQRFLRPGGRAGDVELQVAELHGKAGDVALTDLRLLHTLAPNASHQPRIMLTQRYLSERASEALHRAYAASPGGVRHICSGRERTRATPAQRHRPASCGSNPNAARTAAISCKP